MAAPFGRAGETPARLIFLPEERLDRAGDAVGGVVLRAPGEPRAGARPRWLQTRRTAAPSSTPRAMISTRIGEEPLGEAGEHPAA